MRWTRILGGTALFAAVLGAGLWCLLRDRPAVPVSPIRLAARTVAPPRAFPEAAAAVQRPSARGTVPYLLACAEPVTGAVRARAAACGARVVSYLPDRALLVEADAPALAALAREKVFTGAVEYGPSDKLAASVRDLPDAAVAEMAVLAFDETDLAGLAAAGAEGGGETFRPTPKGSRVLHLRLSGACARQLAARGDVRWIECAGRPRLFNDLAVKPGLMNVEPVWTVPGLTGAGQIVTTSDSGLDTGKLATLAADFTDRIVAIQKANAWSCATKDYNGHGTHTAGSIVGTGALSDGTIRGVAFGARLWVWACAAPNGDLYFPSYGDLFNPDSSNPGYIHSASWGETNAYYSAQCLEADEWLWDHPAFLAVFSAGNEGRQAGCTIGDPAGAKNVLAVGASESLRSDYPYGSYTDNPASLASFSSRGPMPDGRIKPDLCAPGTGILSVRAAYLKQYDTDLGWGSYAANTNYTYCAGTSMSTPLVAGCAALVREWLVTRRGFTDELPSAALMKAILTGGAHDLSGDPGASCGGTAPNGRQGWGRVDLQQTIVPTNAVVALRDRVSFAQDSACVWRIRTTRAAPLDIQLAWIDAPGDPAAAQAIVNDLDLVVSNETTGAVWYGNDVSNAGVRDTVNTVESVRLAEAEADWYTIRVEGRTVPYDSLQGGAAALYVRGAMEDDSVSVTIVADAEGGVCDPPPGTYTYAKGVRVRFTARDMLRTNEYGTAFWRRAVAGWTGTGSVTNGVATNAFTVCLETDSTIAWSWAPPDWLLSCFQILGDFGNSYWSYWSIWMPEGSEWTVEIPADCPNGEEVFDLTAHRRYYWDSSGVRRRLGIQRLGRVECAEVDIWPGAPVFDAAGRMAATFPYVATNAMDILCYYWDEAQTNLATRLPQWWFQRYLYGAFGEGADAAATADADGDGLVNADEFAADTDPLDPESDFRILAFTPTNIVWRGGRNRTQVVERAASLGPAAVWTGVHTNAPPTSVRGDWAIPRPVGSNFFYRIRAF